MVTEVRRPAPGSKWDTESWRHAVDLVTLFPDDPNRGPDACFYCLFLPSNHFWSYHTICRVYEVLWLRRGRWTHLRHLTAITHDITSDQYWFVQQCVYYLRKVYAVPIDSRVGKKPGHTRYRIPLGAGPGHPEARRLWLHRSGAARLG